MLRTSTVLLEPDPRLSEYTEQSAILWNVANYQRRKAFYEHQKTPTYTSQCRELKATEPFKALGTCKAQALLQKLDEAWRSFRALLRLKRKGGLPPHIRRLNPPRYWKEKGKRICRGFFVRNDGWSIDEDTVTIARNVKVPYRSGDLWVGKRGRLEVLRDELSGRWYAHFPVEVDWRPPSRTRPRKASLDLGICNLAALHIEDERPIIYSGRAVLSDWVYHMKRIADEQSLLPKRKHISKRIRIVFRKRQRRLRHAVNTMVRHLFEVLDGKDVGELFVGELTGIRSNGDGDHGRNVNQKVNNFWAFDHIVKRIEELGEEYGVVVRKVSERDTSNTCCLCGEQHNGRVERGLMVCPETHQCINADVNGAVNIMKVAVEGSPHVLSTDWGRISGSGLLAEPLLLRWNYHEWS